MGMVVTRFIDACLTKGLKTTARKREYGTDCDRPVPKRIPGWMRVTWSERSRDIASSLRVRAIIASDDHWGSKVITRSNCMHAAGRHAK